MANVTVRRAENDRTAHVSPWDSRTEPFRAMRSLLGWDPFREMLPLAYEGGEAFSPAFDVKETKDAYLFHADLPGIKESDIEITVTGNRLSVSGKREAERSERGERYYASERTYGSFTRTFTLPDGADVQSVLANLANGVLTLSIPKRAELQPRRVTIGTSGKS